MRVASLPTYSPLSTHPPSPSLFLCALNARRSASLFSAKVKQDTLLPLFWKTCDRHCASIVIPSRT